MTAQAEAEAAAREIAPWIERMARVGYAAKGIVYILIGLLAIRGATGGMDGAFLTILRQPFGEVLLYVIALGLVGYALWRILEGITDPAGRGTDVKGLSVRGFRISRGLFHLFLAWGVFQLARGSSSGGAGSDDGAETWTARLLEQPFGVWLVIGIGLGIVGYGLGQLFRAWKSKLDKQLRIGSLDPGKRKWIIRISRSVSRRGESCSASSASSSSRQACHAMRKRREARVMRSAQSGADRSVSGPSRSSRSALRPTASISWSKRVIAESTSPDHQRPGIGVAQSGQAPSTSSLNRTLKPTRPISSFEHCGQRVPSRSPKAPGMLPG